MRSIQTTGRFAAPNAQKPLMVAGRLDTESENTFMRRASSRTQRFAPVPTTDRTQFQQELLVKANKTSGRDVNIYSTLVHRADLFDNWLDFAHGLLFHGKLAGRDREILILRSAINCEAEYEWSQHLRFAREAGITEEEIEAFQVGADSDVWDEKSRALINAADEMHDANSVSDATWEKLEEHFSESDLYEIVMVVGTYHLCAIMLNSFGVQLDDELEPFTQ